MKKYLFIAIVLFIPVMWLEAQPLDTLLRVAMQNNPELRALYQEYLAALSRAPQVSTLPDPELGVGVFPLPVETRLGPQLVRVGLTQAFPWFGTLKARRNVALAEAHTGLERLEARKVELFYQMKSAYLQLYELDRSRSIMERHLEHLRTLERLAVTRMEAGKGSLAEVMQLRIMLRELDLELELLNNKKIKPLAALNEVLNRVPAAPVAITDSLPSAPEPDTALTVFTMDHPQFRLLEAEQQAAQLRLEVNELEGKPAFSVGADYIVVGERNVAELSDNGRDILAPRVGVKLPLYRGKYDGKAQEEEHRIAALEWRKEAVVDRFRSRIAQAFSDYQEAVMRFELYEQQINDLDVAIRVQREKYAADGSGFDLLLTMHADWTQYHLKKMKEVVKSYLAKAEIEKITLRGDLRYDPALLQRLMEKSEKKRP